MQLFCAGVCAEVTMASGVYPFIPENISGEVSGENDMVNFHKLSGYNDLIKGIFFLKITLFYILI